MVTEGLKGVEENSEKEGEELQWCWQRGRDWWLSPEDSRQ